MEMRAIQDIGVGEDLTLPLRPLAAVLHDSALSFHCSGCFSTLPRHPLSPFGDNSHYVPTPRSAAPPLIPPSIPPPVNTASSPTLLIPCGTPPPTSTSPRFAHVFKNLPQECTFSPQLGVKNESLCQDGESQSPDGCLERIAGLMTKDVNLEGFAFE